MAFRQSTANLLLKLVVFGLVSYLVIKYICIAELGVNHSQEVKIVELVKKIEEDHFQDRILNPKLILFGTRWWHPHYPFLGEIKRMCPQCTFTENDTYFETSDAVVFHGYSLNKAPPVERRRGNQIWIWLSFETTDYVGSTVALTKLYTHMFNWTMTYRSDSDIVAPYGRFVPFEERPLPDLDEKWAFMPSAIPNNQGIYDNSFTKIPTLEEINGRRMVAWIVSHCKTNSRREQVASVLSKYVAVDIYGNCGNFSCDVPKSKSMSGIDCRFQISREYKFYLAFENSLCEDYITEKYFEVLYTQMVPIVYGGADYSKFAPPKSYINVADYPTIKDLANYLNFLDSNPEEYLKYFEWRKTHWVLSNRFVIGFCSLCDKLWNDNSPKSYYSLKDWWYHRSDYSISGKNACFRPDKEIKE